MLGGQGVKRYGEKGAVGQQKIMLIMGETKTQQPEGLTQQSNGPQASTGVTLVDLALKKNAGGPGVEEVW
jgi:hypothetical protein